MGSLDFTPELEEVYMPLKIFITRSGPKIPAADQLEGEASFGFWEITPRVTE